MEAPNRSEWLLSLEVGDEVALQKNTITATHKRTERVVVTHISLMRHRFEVSRKDGTVVELGLWGSVPWSRSGGVGTSIVPLWEARADASDYEGETTETPCDGLNSLPDWTFPTTADVEIVEIFPNAGCC
jgi:hypothetical protein